MPPKDIMCPSVWGSYVLYDSQVLQGFFIGSSLSDHRLTGEIHSRYEEKGESCPSCMLSADWNLQSRPPKLYCLICISDQLWMMHGGGEDEGEGWKSSCKPFWDLEQWRGKRQPFKELMARARRSRHHRNAWSTGKTEQKDAPHW